MIDNYQHIANLITGFNNGTLSATGHNELNEWIAANDKNQLVFEELSDPNRLREYLHQMEGYDEGGFWEKIKKELPLTTIPVRHLFPPNQVRGKLWKKIAVAASIILTLGLGAYFGFFNKTKKEEIVKLPEARDIEAPKGTKAMITLADGRTVSVDSLTSIDQSNVKLTKTSEGKIIYSGSSTKVVFNTLSNPRGSKVIDMTLSDGSHVWLNAGSSIVYPIAFIGNYRKVFITGEAYLQVEHNAAKPFIINANNKGEIEVLGTHFNVNAYEDEDALRTTLLEGKVKFTRTTLSLPTSDFRILTPGQQAILANSKLRIASNVDLEQVMAWKNGNFKFSRTDLKVIMREIGRWYDVEVIYEGNIPVQLYNVGVPRTANVSEVLKGLEYTGAHFSVEGKKIIVRP